MKKILFLFLLCCNFCYAEPFIIHGPLRVMGEYHVLLNGEYDNTSLIQFKKIIKENKNNTLFIHANSVGGSADDILEIMDLIHNHGNIIWIVDNKNNCDSACAWTAIASKKIYGKLKFHGVYFTVSRKLNDTVNTQIIFKLKSYGIEENISKNYIQKELVEVHFN